MKTFFKWLLRIIGVIVLCFCLLIGYLTITEYNPDDKEVMDITNQYSIEEVSTKETLKMLSWNIGYGALGDNADFFMDGGSSVYTANEERVNENINNISEYMKSMNPDIMFLQEVDVNSDRSHNVKEVEYMNTTFTNYQTTFAPNFKVNYIPYPIPPMGKVHSGIQTFTKYKINESTRYKLPCPFSWPTRIANLKRCALVSRVSVKDSDKDLVLVNLHLEAYDDGEGKKAQTELLKSILDEEREKGNYVIAAGDFNQTFSNIKQNYPAQEDKWAPGVIDTDVFTNWQCLMDENTPSCRSLDQSYENANKDTFQYYVIDGYIISDNIKVKSFETKNLDFKNTDHNPVLLEFELES